MVYVDPTTGDIYDPSEISAYIDLLLTEIPSGTVDGVSAVDNAISTQYLEVGAVPLGGLAKDTATGAVIDVTPDSSGIQPLIPVPGKPGTIVNPAWIAHKAAEQIHAARQAAKQVPHPDQTVFYSGAGTAPTWQDVWSWTINEQHDWLTYFAGLPVVTGDLALAAADIIAGSVIKALGGLISSTQLASLGMDYAISSRVDALQATTFGVAANLNEDVANLKATVAFLAEFVIPDLQAQITNLKESIPLQIEQAIQANNIRIRDAWIAPLQTGLQTETQQRVQGDQSVLSKAESFATTAAKLAVAPALAGLAGLATRVGTLEQEAEQCTKPMCATMGPATALGKLLQGLEKALAAGALIELANARESDVADAIVRIATKVGEVINTFETSFVQGGQTVAELVAAELGNII